MVIYVNVYFFKKKKYFVTADFQLSYNKSVENTEAQYPERILFEISKKNLNDTFKG